MKNGWAVSATALIMILALTGPVLAQAADAKAGADKDEAISKVPTYEEREMILDETPQESFLRLAEDTIFISEIGVNSPGSVPLWPRGAFKAGPVLVFPYVVGKISWTNNVFLQERDRSSWFATEGAGFTAEYAFLGGDADIHFGADYIHRDYFNRDLSYSEWVAGLGMGYRFPMGLWLRGGVKWEHLNDPVALEYRGKMERDQFYPYFDIGLKNAFGNKIDITFGVNSLRANFREDEFETSDRVDWEAFAKVSYPFFKETTRIYVKYDYVWSDRKAEVQNDLGNGQRLSFGMEGMIPFTRSERLLGFIQVGYRNDRYAGQRTIRLSPTATGTTDGDSNQGTVSVAAGLQYLLGANTSMFLKVLRDLQFSSRSNYQTLSRGDLTITHNCMRDLVSRFAAFIEHADPSRGGTVVGETHSFTRYGFGLGTRYLVMENLDVDLALDWHRRITSQDGYAYHAFQGTLGATLYFR